MKPYLEILDAATKAERAAYARGYRKGKIEARAELSAIWRNRVVDIQTILNAPIPVPAKDEG